MRNSRTLTAIGLGFAVNVSTIAFSWGTEGHEAVARIAELQLSQKARAGIAELVASTDATPAIDDPKSGKAILIALPEISAWADKVRRDPEWKSTGPWHFVNIPIEVQRQTASYHTYCKNEQCIVDQIKDAYETLADKSEDQADAADKMVALKFLVHLVGDVHQPLHCATWDADLGANKRKVNFMGKTQVVYDEVAYPLSLHSVWDSEMPHLILNGRTAYEYAYDVVKNLDAKKLAKIKQGTPQDWAWTSHDLSRDDVYAGVNPDFDAVTVLGKDYYETNKATIERRILEAGVRLARLLNKAFK